MDIASKMFADMTSNKKVQNVILPFFDRLDAAITGTLYNHRFAFHEKNTEEDRSEIYQMLARKYPNKIPIVVEYVDTCHQRQQHHHQQESRKMLIDYDEYVMRLLATIKRNADSSDSLFVLTDTNKCLMATQTVGEVYKQYLYDKIQGRTDDLRDKIMYLAVYKENTFG
jgi:disulfide oxidoreductase YuzD